MDDNFSSRVKDVITYSKEEALRLGHDFIGTEHLLLGMLRDGGGKAINILNSLEIDLDYLRKKVEILSPPNPINDFNQNDKKNSIILFLDTGLKKILYLIHLDVTVSTILD